MKNITRRYCGYDRLVDEQWVEESPAMAISEKVIMFFEDKNLVFEKVEKIIEAESKVVEVRYDDLLRKKFEIFLPDHLALEFDLNDFAKMSLVEFNKLILDHI
jgi:hypothetical protein